MWRAKPFGQTRELLYIYTHNTADVIRVDLWKKMQAEKLKIILTSKSDNLNISQILFYHTQSLYVSRTCIFQKEINHYNDGQYEGYTTDRQVRASTLSQQYTRLSIVASVNDINLWISGKRIKNNQKQNGD